MNLSKKIDYLDEIKILVKAYGTGLIAKMLDTTERGMQYWTASEERKVPRAETQRKIHELFVKHQSGDDLTKQISTIPDYRDKVIALLEAENLRLKNDLEASLTELKESLLLARAICITNQFFLAEVVAKQRKQDFDLVRSEISKVNSDTVERLKKADRFVVDKLGSGA